MNNLQYSEISDNYYNYYDNNLNNNNRNLYNTNNTNNNSNNNSKNLEYNYNLIDNILLCQDSKNYIKNKILNEDILLKSLYKILNFEKESLFLVSFGMLIVILLLLILNLLKTILR